MSRVKRIRRILLAHRDPTGEGRFPAQVLWFAKEQEARLHLVNVAPPVPANNWRYPTASRAELETALVRERARALERLANRAREKGLKVTTRVRVGDPHIELIREAVTAKADMVVAVEQERTGLLGFAGTTIKLLRKCPTPVWIIRSPLKRSRRRIMAAVDLGPRGDIANQPNGRILEVAASFARANGAKLHVFHAWSLWGEQMLRARGLADSAETERLLWETRTTQKRRLDALVKRKSLDGIDVEPLLEKGLPRILVPEVTRQLKIDVLVMGTLSRTGVPGLLIGNTAERILDNLGCSVVAVKPDGFESPVPTDSTTSRAARGS